MARRDIEEREVTFQELKDMLFKSADRELEGYLKFKDKHGERLAEVQRQRYVALFSVIDNANLYREFKDYQARA